jgi:hypothetical protein
MKGLKILLVTVAALAVVLVLVVVLALTPAVQTWAVRKVVGNQPGMQIEVGHVGAGLSEGELGDLRFVKDGMIITAKGVTARYKLTDYLTQKRINADQVTVEDLVVDLRGVTPATPTAGTNSPGSTTAPGTKADEAARGPARTTPGSAAPTNFNGLLAQAELPFDIRLANLSVKGRALLPSEQTATFELKGSNIETGQRGQVEWTVQFADGTRDAALQSLRSNGTAAIQISAERRITLVDVNATAVATGPKLPRDQFKLEAKAEQPAAGGNEVYALRLGTLQGNTLQPVVVSNAQYDVSRRNIAGTWEISIRSEQLGALLAGLNLPAVTARGNGKFDFEPATSAVNAAGTLQGQVSQLEKLSRELGVIGSVQFGTAFDGGLADNIARLDKLELSLTGAEGRKLADITTLQQVKYSLVDQRATLANPNSQLGRISLQSLPLAWAQPFLSGLTIDRGDVSLALVVETDNTGSNIRARSAEPLLLRGVTVRQGDQVLVDQATLSVKPSIDYSAAKLVAELTEFSLTLPAGDALTGQLKAEVANPTTAPAITFSTQLQGKTVAVLKAYLPVDPGPLAILIGSEGSFEGSTLRLAKATLTANRADGSLLTSVETLQPLSADFKTQQYTVPNAGSPAARVKLGEVPLAWADKFVPNAKFAGVLASGAVELLFRTVDDIGVNTAEPLVLRGVGATMDGRPQFQGLDLTADFTASKRGQDITYDLRKFDLKQGETALAGFTVAGQSRLGDKLNVAAKGKLDADVAALMRQPALVPYATLIRGRLAAVFEANLADSIQAKAVISGRDLVAREQNRPLGNLDVNLVANVKTDGTGNISMPITITNAANKSDVTIEGTIGRSGKNYLVDGRVNSNQLVVDDFQPLMALAPSQPAPAARPPAPAGRPPGPANRPPPSPSKPDEQPFWSGVNGKLAVDLKSVRYGKDYVVQGIRGNATITDSRLGLDGLEGRFKENPFKLSGAVTFNRQQPKPYQLTGAADFTNVNLGEILRSANPSERPAIESEITVSAKLNGNGANVGDLAKGAYGRFELTGSKGVLRALGKKGQALGTGLSIVGGLLGAAQGSETTMAIAQLTSYLNEIPFDSLKMQVERGADLNLKVSALEIISREMRIGGTGGITQQGDAPIQNQPMRFELQFGAKEGLALLLNKARLLGDKQDDKGYYLMSQGFTIGGTPAKPDSGVLWQIIGRAAAGSFLR